ncbi:Acid phosphatase 1 [Morus notabilis]|uniref:Acid phosphatase 1 n=1 Tax=Morus notabilis TaxID=981085 RepID=W9RH17_9ROSA|nr:Acid phosphatase 1 [Morus notabilis]
MPKMLLYFILATVLAQADFGDAVKNNKIYFLRSRGDNGEWCYCSSWQYGVDTNNIIGWKTIPDECELHVGRYMLGARYREDSKVVTKEAYLYAKSYPLLGDGKDVWIFGTDEVALSNLPYYLKHGFGVKPYDSTSFHEWILTENAPALPKSLKLYKRDPGYYGPARDYKSAERKKLEEAGYRIAGNIGDQWSDLLGTNAGSRTFKLPNPMYYVS